MFHAMDPELARARHVERMQLLQPEYSNRSGRMQHVRVASTRGRRTRRTR